MLDKNFQELLNNKYKQQQQSATKKQHRNIIKKTQSPRILN